jgi:branched-chain amino acid transport system ATP-binding protein
LLEIHNLHVSYGQIQAVRNVHLQVIEGEVVTLIGSNGAGKTSTVHAIAGVIPANGSIRYQGKEIVNLPPHQLVKEGIVLVPEGRRVFPRLTVMDNLLMGGYAQKWTKAELKKELDRVFALFPRLAERKNQLAGTMSGGEQQMLAVGRGLMSRPKLLILDEPSMGLAPIVVKGIYETIREIKKSGITMLLIEQNAVMALSVADRVYGLEHGEIAFEERADHLQNQDLVKKTYLGR